MNLSFLGNKRYSRSEALLYSAQCFTQEVFDVLAKISRFSAIDASNKLNMIIKNTIDSRVGTAKVTQAIIGNL